MINDSATMQSVKLVVLGSASSGKTSLIRQFVNHEFIDSYHPTKRKEVYYSTVSLNNERLLELKIIDVPTIFEFPTNNEDEWDFGLTPFGLRTADVYLLVFDATSANSFKFMKQLREQILTNRQDSLIIVAGNKHDLVLELQQSGQQIQHDNNHHHHHHLYHHHKAKLKSKLSNVPQLQLQSQSSKDHHENLAVTSSGGVVFHRKLTKKFASTVRKQWHMTYVECSAKYNWRVTSVFRELIKLVGQNPTNSSTTSTSFDFTMKRKASVPNNGAQMITSSSTMASSTRARSSNNNCKIQ